MFQANAIMVSNNSYSPGSRAVAAVVCSGGSGELTPGWCSTIIKNLNNYKHS